MRRRSQPFAKLLPKLKSDWQFILCNSWCVWLIIAAIVFTAIETALPLLQGVLDIPTGLFAALSGISTVCALIARVLVQKKFVEHDNGCR